MSIKIRCSECEKRVSVDEAFKGGMCRCPYCGVLIAIAGASHSHLDAHKPDSPSRPARPDSPVSEPSRPDSAIESQSPEPGIQDYVPVAKPVFLQGITSIILIAVIGVMLVGGSIVAAHFLMHGWPTPPSAADNNGRDDKPDILEGPAILDILGLTPPVAYCLDNSENMGEVKDAAINMVLHSLESLDGGEFSLIIVDDGGVVVFRGGMVKADSESIRSAGDFMNARGVSGAAELGQCIAAAGRLKPKSVVLLTRETDMTLAGEVRKLGGEGIRFVGIGLQGDKESARELLELSTETGGEGKSLSEGDLSQW